MMLKFKKRITLVYILIIVAIFTYFSAKQFTETKEKNHYDQIIAVQDVISNGQSVSHIGVTLEKGDYQVNDSIYVLLKDSKMHYAKYLLTTSDVESLKNDAIELLLKSIAGVNSYRDRLVYTIIQAGDVEAYETENTSQKKFDLIKPNFMIDELKGSIVDLEWEEADYTKNDEKMNLYFFQSQLYQTGDTIVVKVNGVVKKEITLSDEYIQTLEKTFMTIQLDLVDLLNDYEEGNQSLFFTILLQDQESNSIRQNYITIKRG
jgi:hypothetical protein